MICAAQLSFEKNVSFRVQKMSTLVAEMNRAELVSSLTCPLCDKLYEEATTINECLHTFCRKCIYTKISQENLEHCPECKINLGPNALQKLRPDQCWENVRAKIFPVTNESSLSSLETQAPIDSKQVEEANSKGHPPKSIEIPVNSSDGNELKVCKSKSKVSRRKARIDNEKKKAPANSSNSAETNKCSVRNARKKQPATKASDPLRALLHNDSRAGCESMGVWFSLFASEEKEGRATLPQLSSRYMRIRDGNANVSHIQKYVIKKLELSPEADIEIQCMGLPVDPNVKVQDLSKLWMQSAPKSQRFSVTPGSTGEEFVIKLGYIRKVNVHPSLACLQDYVD